MEQERFIPQENQEASIRQLFPGQEVKIALAHIEATEELRRNIQKDRIRRRI